MDSAVTWGGNNQLFPESDNGLLSPLHTSKLDIHLFNPVGLPPNTKLLLFYPVSCTVLSLLKVLPLGCSLNPYSRMILLKFTMSENLRGGMDMLLSGKMHTFVHSGDPPSVPF